MIKREIKKVTKKEEVVTAVICDGCGKEHISDEYPKAWHIFDAHHNDWGNDSIESYQYFVACSPKCYTTVLRKLVGRYNYTTAVIDGMNHVFASRMSEYLKEVTE